MGTHETYVAVMVRDGFRRTIDDLEPVLPPDVLNARNWRGTERREEKEEWGFGFVRGEMQVGQRQSALLLM